MSSYIKLCRVTAPHFVAACLFEKKIKYRWIDDQWSQSLEWVCIDSAPILRYLVGETGPEVKRILKKKGYTWEWVTGKEDQRVAQGELWGGP